MVSQARQAVGQLVTERDVRDHCIVPTQRRPRPRRELAWRSHAPDMIARVRETDSSVMTAVPTAGDKCGDRQQHLANIVELKDYILTGVRAIIVVAQPQPAPMNVTGIGEEPAVSNSNVTDSALLTFELPATSSWRDYVTQYWTSNPYRAGIDMLPHDQSIHRCWMSQMKTVAEFVKDNFGGSIDDLREICQQIWGRS
ncbi:hypothetical protein PybrP1_005717 [[Pythium] brassicae (nom. inval.)]|nr:hypothetical protein PybrP1_005717 [[Pythium] brassicae (nom. inval.)]